MNRMPAVYREPMGLPLRWQDDQTGELPKAVWAYLNHGAGKVKEPPTEEQLSTLKDYLAYYIKAPCWMHNAAEGMEAELKAAILKIDLAVTHKDIRDFIYACLDMGIDPL